MAGDGQVTMNNVVAKANATKVRKLSELGADGRGVLVGYAGGAADALSLVERFEGKLKETPRNLKKAAVELAKLWRTDRALRRLEALIAVADASGTLLVSGTGDVIEPQDGVLGIGSGGSMATAAARALLEHTEQTPVDIARHALMIAGDLCVYTNQNITLESL